MSEYSAPIEDMTFVMSKLANIKAVLDLPGQEELSQDIIISVLDEASRLAGEIFAPLNAVGDRVGTHLVDGNVVMPPGFKEAYRKYAEAGWGGLAVPVEHGGQGMPYLVGTAVAEMWKSANLALSANFLLTGGAIEALVQHGSAAQTARFLPRMVSGEWGGVMNLTEPQAGSDLAAIKTRAVPQSDGTYKLFGQKCFITYADNDMVENVVHLVLARLPDAPEGVKGISMFVVSQHLLNADDSLGERNDVQVVALEKKLGQHASPTCVVLHGETKGAVAELVGEPGAGLVYIFVMVNAARLAVALEGVGIAERAYQQALDYARNRIQGREPGSGKPVAIARHPDVRRMLMTMKAQTEAMRSVAYVIASWLDIASMHNDADERQQHQNMVDLLIPVLKGWMTEAGADVASIGIQIHGGAGYVEETGAAQHFRDVRVTSIYEGTTGIQAADLVGRKIARQPGPETARRLLEKMRLVLGDLAACSGADIDAIRASMSIAMEAVTSATETIIVGTTSDPTKALAVSVPYLKLLGITLGGWQMALAALAARKSLNAGEGNAAFMQQKIATARYYADHILPTVSGLAFTVQAGQQSVFLIDFESD